MANSINEFILNNANTQAVKDTAKNSNQYMTKEADKSFDMVFKDVNKYSNSNNYENKYNDKQTTGYKNNQNAFGEQNQSLKKDEYAFGKTAESVVDERKRSESAVKEKYQEKTKNTDYIESKESKQVDNSRKEESSSKSSTDKKDGATDSYETQAKEVVKNADTQKDNTVKPDSEEKQQAVKDDNSNQNQSQKDNDNNPKNNVLSQNSETNQQKQNIVEQAVGSTQNQITDTASVNQPGLAVLADIAAETTASSPSNLAGSETVSNQTAANDVVINNLASNNTASSNAAIDAASKAQTEINSATQPQNTAPTSENSSKIAAAIEDSINLTVDVDAQMDAGSDVKNTSLNANPEAADASKDKTHVTITAQDNTANNKSVEPDKITAAKPNTTDIVDNAPKTEILDTNASLDESQNQTQIKASENVKSLETAKADAKDARPQTAVSQAVIDRLNAEVVNNNNSSNTGSNFSRQQNAAEQIVKLSIESMTLKSEAPDFTHLMNQDKVQLAQDKIQVNIPQTPAKELSKFDILNQIAEKLPNLKAGSEKVEIILKPERLGKVNVELQSTRGLINATLIAENKQVKELLEKNIDTLRNNLTSQGVNVNNITVKVDESAKSQFNTFDFNQGQFGSEAQDQQQGSQRAYDSDNSNDIKGQNIAIETEEGAVSMNEPTEKGSLHDGMVDYKV